MLDVEENDQYDLTFEQEEIAVDRALGASYADSARKNDISPTAAKQRLARAIERTNAASEEDFRKMIYSGKLRLRPHSMRRLKGKPE